uniref:Putative hydroxypyruvate isomerase n=1 Tax=Culicoides sonorensis TaxID=179676 RepID=A0A336MKW6_CULSO
MSLSAGLIRSMFLKFCANLAFQFNEAPNLIEKFRLAKATGFKAVEMAFPANTDLDDLIEVKKETGLEIILMNIDLGDVPNGQFGCASFVNSCEDFRKNLINTIKYAKALECKKIHIMAGKHTEPTDEKNNAFYLANLRAAALLLHEENLMGVIEPINKYSVPGYFLNCYEKAIHTIKTVNQPNLRLMVDLFHLQHIRGDITNSLREFAPYIGHVQIAQCPGRHEPDTDGEVNFKYVLKVLEEYYSDYVGCEYRPLNGTVEGLKWIKDFGYDF